MRNARSAVVVLALLIAGGGARGLEMGLGEPASVLAERLGAQTAELAACGVGQDDLRRYAEKAKTLLAKRAKKPEAASVDVTIMDGSYREQGAAYAAGTETPHCDTVVDRASLR